MRHLHKLKLLVRIRTITNKLCQRSKFQVSQHSARERLSILVTRRRPRTQQDQGAFQARRIKTIQTTTTPSSNLHLVLTEERMIVVREKEIQTKTALRLWRLSETVS